jgi:hypothetical protein
VTTVQSLRFERCPSVSNRPQRASDGREYRIERIALPFCWAVEVGVDDGRLYQLIIERRRRPGGRQVPVTAEQRPLYQKLRRCGISREEALAAIARGAA